MSGELNPQEFRELVVDAYLTDPIPPITCMTDKALLRLEELLRQRYDAQRKQAAAALPQETATREPVGGPIKYQPGEWYEAKDRDDLEAFFRSRLPAIRAAAREHGYAIGLHGSMRRDLDLIAAPWREGASDKDVLAHAIAKAACGITCDGPYQWEQKPLGRVAASLSCCWPRWFNEAGAGHIDLSVAPTNPALEPMSDQQIAKIYEVPELAGSDFPDGTARAIALIRAYEAARGINAQAQGGA